MLSGKFVLPKWPNIWEIIWPSGHPVYGAAASRTSPWESNPCTRWRARNSIWEKMVDCREEEIWRKYLPLGREPWSSGYGRRLMFWRSWVQIPAPYAGWTFFTFLCCKNCNCFKRLKNEKEAGITHILPMFIFPKTKNALKFTKEAKIRQIWSHWQFFVVGMYQILRSSCHGDTFDTSRRIQLSLQIRKVGSR